MHQKICFDFDKLSTILQTGIMLTLLVEFSNGLDFCLIEGISLKKWKDGEVSFGFEGTEIRAT